jgi:pseudouridine synthase
MAQANIGSRRACEELIREGRVRVNGTVIDVGAKADPAIDTIVVDGETLRLEAHPHIYIALHKPVNVLSTTKSHKGDKRRTVFDLVRADEHLFMIGRLDAESQGLMVLTNDGELTNRLTHPRYQHTKTYKVTVYGLPTQEVIEQWEQGVYLPEDGLTSPCSVRITKASGGLTMLQIVMTEGKKRQIRRIASHLGFPVRHLIRTHIGQLAMGDMKPGEYRELSPSEVKAMSTPDPILRTIRVKQKRKK